MDNLKPRCSGKGVVVKLFVHASVCKLNTAKLHYCTNNTLIAVVVYNIYEKQGKTQHTAVI